MNWKQTPIELLERSKLTICPYNYSNKRPTYILLLHMHN